MTTIASYWLATHSTVHILLADTCIHVCVHVHVCGTICTNYPGLLLHTKLEFPLFIRWYRDTCLALCIA